MKISFLVTCLLVLITALINGCKKYLDIKPDQSLVIINTLDDMQSLLDNFFTINTLTVSADNVSADDYYITPNDYQALTTDYYRNMYIWNATDLWAEYTISVNDWGQVYNNIYLANTVLANINKVQRTAENASTWDNIKGQAHFLRAYSFYKAASIFCLAYDENSASNELGLPLRLDPDLNIPSKRSTLKETYDQILNDAQMAADLLPTSPLHVSRSAKPAAYALLSKIYLAIRQYDKAFINADNSLKLYKDLIDYNTLNSSLTFPIGIFNKEVLYHTVSGTINAAPASSLRAKIDTTLLKLYDDNDLRKSVFFRDNPDGTKTFKGSYNGSSLYFNGIATDEVYLIRAECFARLDKPIDAMNDINALLMNRYRTGTYKSKPITNTSQVLSVVLAERRKELLMRGIRWMDIKRLNKEGSKISLKRIIDNVVYTLPPNDLRFALPIPEDIILRSGMQQNPR
ncbi:RagB/SusD family nutrient uptake outer membrane protein [Chryseobacterium sp. Marseille-Q8038]